MLTAESTLTFANTASGIAPLAGILAGAVDDEEAVDSVDACAIKVECAVTGVAVGALSCTRVSFAFRTS